MQVKRGDAECQQTASIRVIIGASHQARRNTSHSKEVELMAAALVLGQVAL